MIRSLASIFSIATILLLACRASEEKTDTPAPVRVDTAATVALDPMAADIGLAPVDKPTPINTGDVSSSGESSETSRVLVRVQSSSTVTATDIAEPIDRRPPTFTAHFDAPALPTPILDGRMRSCIAYPLTTSFAKVRYNLLLQPNMYEVARRNWSDPKWLATFRVVDGWFPVALWRIRSGEATFWRHVWVQAGPELPTGNPQTALSAEFFRGGDVLCVESPRDVFISPLFIAGDGGQLSEPRLSAIQNASNDSTPIPGAWMTISANVTSAEQTAPMSAAAVAPPPDRMANTQIQYRFPDWKRADGTAYPFDSYLVRFELLIDGQRRYAAERTITGLLSAQCWTAVLPTDDFMVARVSTRLVLVKHGYTSGSPSWTIPNSMGTSTSTLGVLATGVCR